MSSVIVSAFLLLVFHGWLQGKGLWFLYTCLLNYVPNYVHDHLCWETFLQCPTLHSKLFWEWLDALYVIFAFVKILNILKIINHHCKIDEGGAKMFCENRLTLLKNRNGRIFDIFFAFGCIFITRYWLQSCSFLSM